MSEIDDQVAVVLAARAEYAQAKEDALAAKALYDQAQADRTAVAQDAREARARLERARAILEREARKAAAVMMREPAEAPPEGPAP